MGNYKGRPTHGLYNSHRELYSKWDGMRSRCYRRSNVAYSKYGGRGIAVCEQWRKSFANFMSWAIENGWQDGKDLSIDRIDNAKGYFPENCRIATRSQQARNRRGRTNVSGFSGVEKHNWGWRAYATIGGKKKHLGVFATPEEAAAVSASAK